MHIKGKGGRQPPGNLYSCQQHYVQQGEEHGKVTLRCHPQLDVRHILKRSLYLRYASQDTHHPHHRQRQAMHSEQITHYQHQRRGYQKELIREMKLHAKQHREPYSHTCQRTAEQKQYIFHHPRMFAYHIVHGTHVYTATELKAEGLQQVYPRSHALWHPFVEHRHGKRWRSVVTCMFIVTHIYIYGSYLYSTSHSTFIPARSFPILLFLSRRMRTGMRCSIFTKLPVALSCGIME